MLCAANIYSKINIGMDYDIFLIDSDRLWFKKIQKYARYNLK